MNTIDITKIAVEVYFKTNTYGEYFEEMSKYSGITGQEAHLMYWAIERYREAADGK